MKIVIASLFVIASACIGTTSAQAAPNNAPKQYFARYTYSGGQCQGLPISVGIMASGTPCKPMACSDGIKKVCVPGGPATHVNFIKKAFEKRPFVLNSWYRPNTNCAGAPTSLVGLLADGTCRSSQTQTINKDLSFKATSYGNAQCTGGPVSVEKKTAKEAKGQCINNKKTTAMLGDSV